MSECGVYDTVYNCTRPRQGCTDQGEKKSFFPLALTGHSNSVFFLNGEIVRCKIVIIFDKKRIRGSNSAIYTVEQLFIGIRDVEHRAASLVAEADFACISCAVFVITTRFLQQNW